jgi:hypothetical protein
MLSHVAPIIVFPFTPHVVLLLGDVTI